MAALTEDQKRYVVFRLAAFRTPTEVVEEVKDIWGIEVSRQQIHYYNPTTPGARTSEKWTELFHAARRAYLEEEGEVAIAVRRWRLEEIQNLYRRALQQGRHGNIPLALQALEQAAKEEGGKFTNHQLLDVDHSGELSGVLMVSTPEADPETWEEHARRQQERLADRARSASRAAAGGGDDDS